MIGPKIDVNFEWAWGELVESNNGQRGPRKLEVIFQRKRFTNTN